MHSIVVQVLIYWAVLLGTLFGGASVLRLARRRSQRFEDLIAAAVDGPIVRAKRSKDDTYWLIFGVFLIGIAVLFLEVTQPYFFTQDDARVAELPGMLEGCRSVWNGIWPDYDPSRLMGGPLAGVGLFSLTYPPTYISYAIARHVLHDENAMLEVFATLHLIAGYLITFALCRRLGMRSMVAGSASLSFILSGSILIMGRSWHATVPVVVWTPLLMMAVGRLVEGDVGWRWVASTGLIAGVAFHVGFPQFWVYTVMLPTGAALWLAAMGRIPLRRLIDAAAAALVAAGVAAPLLVPQLIAARGSARPGGYGSGLTTHWLAAVLPYPLIKITHPNGWGSYDAEYMGHFLYFGTVFAVLFVVSLMAVCSGRPSRRVLGSNVWLVAGCFMLLLTMGRRGALFFLMTKLPLIKMVNNNPFRALPFFVLCAVVGSGIVVERVLQHAPRAISFARLGAGLLIGLLSYHVWMARPSFYSYGFDPYPPLAPAMAARLQGSAEGRMISWTTVRSIAPSFAAALPLDLPMAYGVLSFSGYDPLLESRAVFQNVESCANRDPVAAMRAYGVRWHLVSELLTNPIVSPNGAVNYLTNFQETTTRYAFLEKLVPTLKPVAVAPGVVLTEMADVAPLAFPEGKPEIRLPITVSGAGIDVNLAGWPAGGPVVVNFIWFPQMQATADGQMIPIGVDQWERMVVNATPGAKVLHVRYQSGWMAGIAVGAMLWVVGAMTFWVGKRFTGLQARDDRGLAVG